MIRPERTTQEIEAWHQRFQQVRLAWIDWLEANAAANRSFEEAWQTFIAVRLMPVEMCRLPNDRFARKALAAGSGHDPEAEYCIDFVWSRLSNLPAG